MHKFECGDIICRKVIPNDEIYGVIRCEESGYYVEVYFERLNEKIDSNFEGVFMIIPYTYEDMYELKDKPDLDTIEKCGIEKSVVYGLTEEKIIDIISMYEKGYTSQRIEQETICGLSDVEAVIKTFNVINRNTQATNEIYICENETLVKELNELYRKIALKLLEK